MVEDRQVDTIHLRYGRGYVDPQGLYEDTERDTLTLVLDVSNPYAQFYGAVNSASGWERFVKAVHAANYEVLLWLDSALAEWEIELV